MFAEAPVDSDVFLSYIHHNYTAFTNEVEECLGVVEYLSAADSLMRMEGDEVSHFHLIIHTPATNPLPPPSQWLRRTPLTSQYSFAVSVRGTLISLPSPVPRRKQVLRKSELWDKLRLTRANEEGVEALYRRRDGVAVVPPWDAMEGGDPRGGGAQRSRRSVMTEVVPFAGMISRAMRKGGGEFPEPCGIHFGVLPTGRG